MESSKSNNKPTNLRICEKMRPIIYKPVIGTHWPFKYEEENDKLIIQKNLETDSDKIPVIYLSLGKVVDLSSKDEKFPVPEVVHRLNKNTSQGQVFVVSARVDDADIFVVVKADKIRSQEREMWFTKSRKTHIKGTIGTHVVICDAYMDGMASILLSNLTESGQSPHFPVCYGTNVSYCKMKRNTRGNAQGGSLSQVIWMEYLPMSLYHVLKEETNALHWWGSLFQINTALIKGWNLYRFIHNDMHCANIRVRRTEKATNLYYRSLDGVYFCVPTGGYICVLIDFGRACFAPNPQGDLLVSSEFDAGGACHGYLPDTRNIDLVRYILSIEDQVGIISDEAERNKLHKFLKEVCVTDNGIDLFEQVAKKQKLNYYLDECPRKHCKQSFPEAIFMRYCHMFQCRKESIPENAEIYEIPIRCSRN